MLALRSCDKNLQSYGSFQYPTSGLVVAPDWNPVPCCGYGLHGFAWGQGAMKLGYPDDPNRKWLVLEVLDGSVVDLGDKVKFPAAFVKKVGTAEECAQYIYDRAPEDKKAFMPFVTVRQKNGLAQAGEYGTALAGSAGCIATARNSGTAKAGYCSIAAAGEKGTACTGERSVSVVREHGRAESGNCSVAYAHERGTCRTGHCGVSVAGIDSAASAGPGGVLVFQYHDESDCVLKSRAFHVDGERVLPHVLYMLASSFIEKDDMPSLKTVLPDAQAEAREYEAKNRDYSYGLAV